MILQPPFATLQQTVVACITDTMHHIVAIPGASKRTAQLHETETNEHQIDTASLLIIAVIIRQKSTVQQTNTAQSADPR